jgi:hypothetical protein
MIFKIIKDKNKNALRAISIARTSFLIDNIPSPGPVRTSPRSRAERARLQRQSAISMPTINREPPKIVQISNDRLGNNDVSSTLIDVVKDFKWKESPNPRDTQGQYLIEHPYIYLREYRVNKSTLFTQLLANLKTIAEGLVGQAGIGVSLLPGFQFGVLAELGLKRLTGNEELDIQRGVSTVIENAQNGISSVVDDMVGNFSENPNIATEYLNPYKFLYSVEKTDFEYKFPFFNINTINKRASWQSNFSDSKMSTGAAGVGDFIETSQEFIASHGAGMGKYTRLFENNQYIERGKYFNPSDSEPITFNFPLLNTGSLESIKSNFDLIWLLCFQTLAIRSGIADIESPCIYEVTIPGWRYMLFAIIGDIKIEHLGTRRRVRIAHPASEIEVDVIIPEVYKISLTIRSLLPDSANLLLRAANHTVGP